MTWEQLPEILWGQVSLVGLVAYGVLALYRGWWVTGASVSRMEKGYEEQISRMEREYKEHLDRIEKERRAQIEDWKSALQIREAGNLALLDQNARLIEVAIYRYRSNGEASETLPSA